MAPRAGFWDTLKKEWEATKARGRQESSILYGHPTPYLTRAYEGAMAGGGEEGSLLGATLGMAQGITAPAPAPAPPPPSSSMAPSSGSPTSTVAPAGPAPTIGELLATQQQQPADPLAGLTPAQLAKPVVVGGTYSSSRRTTSGIPDMPGRQEALQRTTEQQQRAIHATAEARAAGARQRATAGVAQQATMEARQAGHEKSRAGQLAKIEQLDATAATMRQEIAEEKVNPEEWWGSRTTLQKIGFGLAAALQGYVMGYRGQAGPSPVFAQIDREIERDIAAQKQAIMGKRQSLADTRGAMADMYRRLGDLDQAEAQTRIFLKEGLKSRMDVIAASSQSEVIKHNAEQASAQLQQQVDEAKVRAYVAAQSRTVRTSSRSVRKAPLASVLQARQAAGAQKARQVPPAIIKEMGNMLESAQQLRRLKLSYKKYHPTVLGALGGRVAPESAKYLAILKRTRVGYVKAMAGAAASDSERKDLGETFAEGVGLRETYEDGLQKLQGHINDVTSKFRNRMATFRAFGFQLPTGMGAGQRGVAQK